MAAVYSLALQPPEEIRLVSVECKIINGCIIYKEISLLVDHQLCFLKEEEC